MAGRIEPQTEGAPPQDPGAAQPSVPQPSAGSARLVDLTAVEPLPILAVDDVPENLQALEAVLAPLGYPLQTANSGSEALKLLLESEFALILLDVRMPGLDGLETARLIKGRDRTRDVPIVFLTAARDEVRNIIRGYGIGAIDYVLKPFDAELLRSKVAVFVELEASRRALRRSEAFLRGAFDAAPIGKTVLDAERRIIRSNPAFARFVGRLARELTGIAIADLCVPEDRVLLGHALDRIAAAAERGEAAEAAAVDLRLLPRTGDELWVGLVATSIEPTEFDEPMLLVQWVDLSVRRRAEQARAELLLEQAARAQAEAMAERLQKLQALTNATETLALDELLVELAARLRAMFDAEAVELEVTDQLRGDPIVVRAEDPPAPAAPGSWHERALMLDRAAVGSLRLRLAGARPLSDGERALLGEACERTALAIRRAELHEEEHHIAVVLQRGLLPKVVPSVAGVKLAVHYEAAGLGAEVGGDWYDTFELPGGRLGVVLGDVAGRSIPAASAMGQLRTVTRAFALLDDGRDGPGQVLTRLAAYHVAQTHNELFTVIYAIIDPAGQRLSWACAGHLPPLVVGADGQTSYLQTIDGLIGLERTAYTTLSHTLQAGDALVLYTDGLVERRGESLDTGLERLAQAAASGPPEPQAMRDHLLARLIPRGERLADDVTALVARLD